MMSSSSAEKAKKLRRMRNEGLVATGLGFVGLLIGKSLPIEIPQADAFAVIIWGVAITELARLGLILIGHSPEIGEE